MQKPAIIIIITLETGALAKALPSTSCADQTACLGDPLPPTAPVAESEQQLPPCLTPLARLAPGHELGLVPPPTHTPVSRPVPRGRLSWRQTRQNPRGDEISDVNREIQITAPLLLQQGRLAEAPRAGDPRGGGLQAPRPLAGRCEWWLLVVPASRLQPLTSSPRRPLTGQPGCSETPPCDFGPEPPATVITSWPGPPLGLPSPALSRSHPPPRFLPRGLRHGPLSEAPLLLGSHPEANPRPLLGETHCCPLDPF